MRHIIVIRDVGGVEKAVTVERRYVALINRMVNQAYVGNIDSIAGIFMNILNDTRNQSIKYFDLTDMNALARSVVSVIGTPTSCVWTPEKFAHVQQLFRLILRELNDVIETEFMFIGGEKTHVRSTSSKKR